MELQAQSTPERNFSIINPLNFMRAEYNGAMGIPNNCQLFCEAHENGISLGFSLPILSQILIVLVYEFVYDYLFNGKKNHTIFSGRSTLPWSRLHRNPSIIFP